jgi:hypothetical protein
MRYGWATAVLAAMSVVASARTDETKVISCPRDAGQQINVAIVSNFYLQRSLAIVEAARKSEAATLRDLVSPDASFATIEGDVGQGPRSKGAAAAVEFFQSLTPTAFRYFPASPGPFSMDPCVRATAELELTSRNANEVHRLRFEYRDGLLTQVRGSRTVAVVGSFD